MFALSIWGLLYGAGFYLAEKLSDMLGIYRVITVFFMLLFLIAFICYSLRHNKPEYYGICAPDGIRLILPVSAILLIAPLSNLFFTDYSIIEMGTAWRFLADSIIILFAAFFEELAFRGVLPLLLDKKAGIRVGYGTIISNIIFAVLHIQIPYASAGILVTHIFIAFSIGLSFSYMKDRTHSIIPAVFLHFLINMSYTGGMDVFSLYSIIWIIVSAFCLIYVLHFYFKKEIVK